MFRNQRPTPFGRMSTYRISRLRTIIRTFYDWMTDYEAGRANSPAPPFWPGVTSPLSPTEQVAEARMFNRTKAWLDVVDNEELQKAAALNEMRQNAPEAYRAKMNGRATPSISEDRVTAGLKAMYPLDWESRGQDARDVVRDVLEAADRA